MAGFAELPCCPRCSGRTGSESQSFGVRSYLHLFYEDCAFVRPKDEEDDQELKAASLSSSLSWYSLLWKASLTAGLLLAVIGGVALTVGLFLPPQIEGFGEGELLMVDERAIGHNGMLAACRLAGGLLLALGGTVLLACTLASPICRAMERIRDDGTYHPNTTERGCLSGQSPKAWAVPNISPIQSMLPVSLSHTFSVQPKTGL